VAGRAVALLFGYVALRRMVVSCGAQHRMVFPRHVTAVAFSGAITYALMWFFIERFAMHPLAAKACAEAVLLLPVFFLLRECVFCRPARAPVP
jgi:hypothetical protein